MEFETQRGLLEYLGKNPNDRSLVQRMIMRGDVYRENGMYILVNRDEKIRELEFLVQKLRSEITTMKESNWDLEEAKIQWEYWENQTRRYVDYLEKVISVTYDRVKPMLGNKLEEKSEFREHILEEVRELSKYKD